MFQRMVRTGLIPSLLTATLKSSSHLMTYTYDATIQFSDKQSQKENYYNYKNLHNV